MWAQVEPAAERVYSGDQKLIGFSQDIQGMRVIMASERFAHVEARWESSS